MQLKELKDLLKLLREKGVLEYESESIRLKLSEEAPVSKYKQRQETTRELEEEAELSEEELLYYSATPPLENIEQ